MKRCQHCRKTKPLTQFPKNRTQSDGHNAACKKCNNANARRWRLAYPERNKASCRKSWLKSQYGITVEQYAAMLKRQKGKCAICGKPPSATRRHAVDHDHATGAVRALLCAGCNVCLAHLENAVWYKKASNYLKRHHPLRFEP